MMGRLRREASGRLLAGLAVTVGLLLPLAVFGAPALARTGASASEYSSSAQYQYKITICHATHSRKHPAHTIRVSARAWPAHKRHGDHLGACDGTEQSLSKHNHGKSHGHGASSHADSGKSHGNNGHDQGNQGHGNQGKDG